MKIDVENLSPSQKRIQIELPWDKVSEELEEAYRGLSKRARVKGFRAGKVPRKVLEQMYARHVEGEVINRLVEDSLRACFQKEEIYPLDKAELDGELSLKPDAPFSFAATVAVKPEVPIKNYKGIELTKKVRPVSEAAVEEELKALQAKATVVEPVTDREEAQTGDMAVVDFFGEVGGTPFKGGKGINYTVELGGGQMIPGWEDQVVGMTIGAQKKFQLKFPEGQSPEDVGDRMVDWTIDLKEIKQKILPELDDEFAKDLGEYESMAELTAKIQENLASRQDAQATSELRGAAITKLVGENEVEPPPVMIESELDHMQQELLQLTKNNPNPMFENAIKGMREEYRATATEKVSGRLLLAAVVREEGISLTDEEFDSRLEDTARAYRMTGAQLKAQVTRDGQVGYLKREFAEDKALDFVIEHAKITEEQVAEDSDQDNDEGEAS